ncbi:MAG: hypothetical protein J0H02_10725 [Armatimonadetes bacterium]|nr:hypothetical protein [Armatimonadota bacterium]
MRRSDRILLVVFCSLAGCGMCPLAAVQLLAEGPHGPGGRITGAPGADVRALIFLAIGAGLIGIAIWAAKKKPGD